MRKIISIIILYFIFSVAYSKDKGRYLFVDDYIIESSTLGKQYHTPNYYKNNPILYAQNEWELSDKGEPYAAPFSGGVWYDESDNKFKMWYSAGGKLKNGLLTCYAESIDGINWTKPMLDVVECTNIVDTLEHDCVSVIIDKFEKDSAKRYKMISAIFNSPSSVRLVLKYSHDGIHWSEVKASSGEIHDRTGFYYDPFRKEYVLSLKTINGIYRRARNYIAGEDLELIVSLTHRTFDQNTDKYIRFWFNADDDDPRHELFPNLRAQIYNHEATPYESLLLGYFTIWQGPENGDCRRLGIQKKNEVLIGWSRDGFAWNRENKTPFMPVGEKGSWNEGNIQSTAGNPIIVGDSLYFYVSGRYSNPEWRSNFSTGLATLRRDGFVSYKAGSEKGFVLTKKINITSPYLFINANMCSALDIEIISDGQTIKSKTLRSFDSTREFCMDLSKYKGRDIQIKFSYKNGDLYSFWFSGHKTGESGGFTAGGGPGLSPSGIDIPVN